MTGKKLTAQELVNSLTKNTTPITIELGTLGKTVTITKLKMRHIPTVLVVFDLLRKEMEGKSKELDVEFDKLKAAEDAEGLTAFANDIGATDGVLVQLISQHFDKVVELLSVCSGLTIEEANDLDLDEATAIATGVVLMNRDFFMERVLPTMLKLFGSVPKAGLNNT